MSPAPITEEVQPDPPLEHLQAVGKAFDALLLTLYRLTHRHNELKQHSEDVLKQCTNITRQLPPQDRPHAMEVQQRLLDQHKQLSLGLVHSDLRMEEQSLSSKDVINTLVTHQNVDEIATQAIVNGVKGFKALLRFQDDLSQISSAKSCIMARGPPSRSLEQDFTTNGTQGSLHCPFSRPRTPSKSEDQNNGMDGGPRIQVDTCGNDNLDPIRAEQEERRSSTAPSGRSSASRCPVSRCPIRYLDKHSPEEIAEYVERHKHEIPRSHAICVKRYQRDPQNMRHLDAKYGGLINMINGLSVKHQAFLPDRQTNGVAGQASSHSISTERVERWADNVDPDHPGSPRSNGDDNRQSHFDRPLREVRVGESPSRPWGIPVPLPEPPATSAHFSGPISGPMSSESHLVDPIENPLTDGSIKPAGRCPFDHGAPKPEPAIFTSPQARISEADLAEEEKAGTVNTGDLKTEDPVKNSDANSVPTHVTFNGPVFFGYSAEQTASLMQQLGALGKF